MEEKNITILRKGIAELNIELTGKQIEQMSAYLAMVDEWNHKMNLVCYHDEEELWRRHLLDSLQCIRAMGNPTHGKLIDIGSGAGFPGLPLAIARPDLRVTLLESIRKKACFLQKAVDHLGLQTVNILCKRAEEAARQQERETFNLVTVRAVAALNILMELALPLLKEDGLLLAMKGKEPEKEITEAEDALDILGARYEKTISYQIEKQEVKTIIVIRKIGATPAKYPRRTGIPFKRPLKKGVN